MQNAIIFETVFEIINSLVQTKKMKMFRNDRINDFKINRLE